MCNSRCTAFVCTLGTLCETKKDDSECTNKGCTPAIANLGGVRGRESGRGVYIPSPIYENFNYENRQEYLLISSSC